jgi:hypothetical protein
MTKLQRLQSKMIWISKTPQFFTTEKGVNIFIGFSKGNTYSKAVHGPIGSV